MQLRPDLSIVAPALAAFGFAATLSSGAVSAVTPDIVPHQAVYALSLGSRVAGADINDVQGSMLFRWADMCEGWEVEQRYVLDFIYSEGQVLKLSSSYETWEAKDHSAFNFSYRTETNGEVDKDIQGVATIPTDDSPGVARYRQPDRVTEDLPAGTFFPTGHTVELLQNAVTGVNFFTVNLFEGTDVQSAIELSAIIGKAVLGNVPAGDEAVSDDAVADATDPAASSLTKVRSWPIRLAFFPADEQLAEPEYEMSMRLFENGVVDELVIDYGEFQVLGKLARIEAITDGGCSP